MKKQTIFLLLVAFMISSSCQWVGRSRTGTIISACSQIILQLNNLQSLSVPEHLLVTGKKRGDEFDVNQYFNALSHISMREGYTLDYVYQNDSLGGFPLLYPRPVDQAPYASMADVPENMQLSDFREYLNVEDVEQGYFEYVVMAIMANQFYLFWHANYNDTEIVCNREEVNDIVTSVSSGDFGIAMNLAAQTKARTMRNIEPSVRLTGDVAIVEVITFTNWGGFYRFTYTISRGFPHTITDVKQENIVPYDCGIAF